MRFSVYQESKKGGRRINQDRMGYLYTRDSLLMLVADGMGDTPRGEVASQLTLQTLASIYQRDAKPLLADPVRFLEDSVLAAHRELHRYRASTVCPRHRARRVVARIIQQGVAIWAHVGDSRLYMIRGGRILDRTIDHSRVHHLVQSGLIDPKMQRIIRSETASSTASALMLRQPSRSAARSLCATATRCCSVPMACGER